MDRPRTDHGHPALANLLGRWRGTTRLESGPWGAERTVDAEMTFTLVAGGSAVVQSYRHTESDGSHFEGHGIFTVDPVRRDVLWYYVDNVSPGPDAPARCTWHAGTCRWSATPERVPSATPCESETESSWTSLNSAGMTLPVRIFASEAQLTGQRPPTNPS